MKLLGMFGFIIAGIILLSQSRESLNRFSTNFSTSSSLCSSSLGFSTQAIRKASPRGRGENNNCLINNLKKKVQQKQTLIPPRHNNAIQPIF
uniref:Uncharacterized protein n=1 Tax=Octopus bimaculoides TaxID=37653 RepID=A0A0L8FZ73_OCTBM